MRSIVLYWLFFIITCILYYNTVLCNILNDIIKTLHHWNYTIQYYTKLFCINLCARLYSIILYYAIQFFYTSVYLSKSYYVVHTDLFLAKMISSVLYNILYSIEVLNLFYYEILYYIVVKTTKQYGSV